MCVLSVCVSVCKVCVVCYVCVLCVCREHVERKLVLPDSFDAREQCVCVKCVC